MLFPLFTDANIRFFFDTPSLPVESHVFFRGAVAKRTAAQTLEKSAPFRAGGKK
jgi:hypothetical protein